MTEKEEKIADLNIDFLIKVSNAALECEDSKEGYKHSMHVIAAAIIMSTPEGRNEFHASTDTRPKSMQETVVAMLNVYYDLAAERGVLEDVKNAERQLLSKEKKLADLHSRGIISPPKGH